MKNLLRNNSRLSFWFRNCCICRLSVPPVCWLCPDCWKKLKSFYLSPRDMIRAQEGLIHIRLFDWNEENDFFIRLFLNSLKRGGPSVIFNKVILEFLHRIVQIRPLPIDAVLIPAPSNPRYHSYDHAFCLASSLAHLAGLKLYSPLLRCFSFDKMSGQKQKTRMQRKEVHFSVKTDIHIGEKIIFVDDILTTGATAQAAYKALGEPENFLIFTLAWRRNFF